MNIVEAIMERKRQFLFEPIDELQRIVRDASIIDRFLLTASGVGTSRMVVMRDEVHIASAAARLAITGKTAESYAQRAAARSVARGPGTSGI